MKTLTPQQQADNAIIWIDSLVKTKVKQGEGMLGNSKEGYCCLGWACKKLKLDYKHGDGFDDRVIDIIGLKRETGGFINEVGNVAIVEGHHSLAEMNDSGDYTFKQISKVIVENIPLLFNLETATILQNHYHGGKK